MVHAEDCLCSPRCGIAGLKWDLKSPEAWVELAKRCPGWGAAMPQACLSAGHLSYRLAQFLGTIRGLR